MNSNPAQLKQIIDAVRARLRAAPRDEVHNLLQMNDYHGFSKARFPESFVKEIVMSLGFHPQDIQMEIVHVGHDLTHEIHLHRDATAVAYCLGPAEGFSTPNLAQAFISDHWFDVHEGDVLEIPAGTPHGFTVGETGSLYFLSVQSPPIVRADGHDDYFRL